MQINMKLVLSGILMQKYFRLLQEIIAVKVFGIVGWSGSGRKALLSRLSKYFCLQGVKVSAILQSTVTNELDSSTGKFSGLHEAGCIETLRVTPTQWFLSHRNSPEPGKVNSPEPGKINSPELGKVNSPGPDAMDSSLERILENMDDVDLVLVEGFKQMNHPKLICIHPNTINQFANTQLLSIACPQVVALVGENPDPSVQSLQLPLFDNRETQKIAEFIARHCRLRLKARVHTFQRDPDLTGCKGRQFAEEPVKV